MAGQRTRRINVLLVGKECSGKTCIIQRYVFDRFTDEYVATKEVMFHMKQVDNENRLYLWDVNGMGTNRFMTGNVIMRKQIILLVYDTNDQDSVTELKYMLNDIESKRDDDSIIGLVGNKIDLERHTNRTEAEEFAKSHDILYYEVSAKSGQNVTDMFVDVFKKFESKYPINVKVAAETTTTTKSGCVCSVS